MITTLDYAKYYRSKGYSVIPLIPRTKEAAIKWKPYQTRLASNEELESWFGNGSNNNIGIVTGDLSGIAVVDLDSEDAIKKISDYDILDAPTVISGKGMHIYCKMKPGVTNFQKRDDLPGIDLRAEGGYIAAPPSIHPTGKPYTWKNGFGLDDRELPEFPDQILAKCNDDKKSIKELLEGVEKGDRHNALIRLVGHWVAEGAAKKDCMEKAVSWNYGNQPQLTLKEIEEDVNDAWPRFAKNKKKDTPADKLFDIASGFKLFHDQYGEPLILLDNILTSLKGEEIKYHLSYLYKKNFDKTISGGMLNQAISALTGKAIDESPRIILDNRIAFKDNAIWYDLGKGRSVKVTDTEWAIVPPSVLFRKYNHQLEQVDPVRGGDPWGIFDYLNIPEEQRLLILVTVISYFVPDIPHPILSLYGSQGSGKTNNSKIIKSVVDPSIMDAIISTRDHNELIQTITHHYLSFFDNMGNLPDWMSDVFSQACTGAAFSKRKLFKDDDDIVYQMRRCLGFNGINMLIGKPDLLDRTILIKLERITEKERRTETDLWTAFESIKSHLLGGIFDTLTRAMKIRPDVNLKKLPRMADYAIWGVAITRALGRNDDEFLNAYDDNLRLKNEHIIRYNTLLRTVMSFMKNREQWTGTVGEAFVELDNLVNSEKDDPTFPKQPNQLIKKLEQIKVNLEDCGIVFSIGKADYKGVPLSFIKYKA